MVTNPMISVMKKALVLTVLLLAGTGATVRVLIGLYRTSLGYDPHHVIIA